MDTFFFATYHFSDYSKWLFQKVFLREKVIWRDHVYDYNSQRQGWQNDKPGKTDDINSSSYRMTPT